MSEYVGKRFPRYPALLYIRDVLLPLVVGLGYKAHASWFVGFDPLCASVGLILRKLKRVEHVIFYTIDYVPQRFTNPFLNRIYHLLDQHCVRGCDFVWNLSSVMRARRSEMGLDSRYSRKQLEVPIGFPIARDASDPKRRNLDELVYVGHLLEKQGVEIAIRALSLIRESRPSARLTIIGEGPELLHLKEIARELSVEANVEFVGFVEDHEEVQRRLVKAGIGVAPYKPMATSYAMNTDVGKVKLYMAAGLPVILTDVPPIAKDVTRSGSGLVVKYDPSALASAYLSIVRDFDTYTRFHQAALSSAQRTVPEANFDRGFLTTYGRIEGGAHS